MNELKVSRFKVNDKAIVFNSMEWSKTYDLPEGNDIYYQEATIIKIRKNSYGEYLADVIFDNGQESHGHFQNGMKNYA